MESIGEKILNLRKAAGVSQEKLAGAVNVARFTVSRWETNSVQPTTENIKALSEFFGVSVSYFFENEAVAVAEETPSGREEPATQRKANLKPLKIACFVAGMVLLVFLIATCGISAYVTISPGAGGEWGEDIHIVNYEGIVFLILGTVAVAMLVTVIVLTAVRFAKSRKNK